DFYTVSLHDALPISQLALGQLTLQQVAVERQGILDGLSPGIEQQYLLPAAGEQLGDTSAHGASADHANTIEHGRTPRYSPVILRSEEHTSELQSREK